MQLLYLWNVFKIFTQIDISPYKRGGKNKQRAFMSNEINKGSDFAYFAEESI